MLTDSEARAVAALLARALVVEAREHGARPTGEAVELLRRLMYPALAPEPGLLAETLTAAETARRMACSTVYVRRLAAAGRLAAEKSDGVWLIRWPLTVSDSKPAGSDSGNIAA